VSQNLPFNVGASAALPIPEPIKFLAKKDTKGETVVAWSPDLAAYVMEHHNKHQEQRNLNLNDSAKLGRVMKAGEWREEHRATWIVFDRNGNLINGQHTLDAISKGKNTLRIRTAWGDPAEDIALYDNFRPRSVAYLVGVRGHNFTTLRAAFSRLRLIIDKGLLLAKVDPTDVETLTKGDKLANTILERVGAASKPLRQAGFPPALTSYAAWRIAKVHGVEKTWDFFDSMMKGANLVEGDQRLQLIRHFRAGPFNQQTDRNRGIAMIITAWNLHHEKSRAKLRVKNIGGIPNVNP
jgi:hypothetical protein